MHQANGNAIHDWHAEVLAVRSFNRFLLDECRNVHQGHPSAILQASSGSDMHPFHIKDNVRLHMYCSEAPCGDASMELTMAAQDDASPWDTCPAPVDPSTGIGPGTGAGTTIVQSQQQQQQLLLGRANFSQLGVVRRKPARGDAPPTLSKSCSDKLTLKQCTSLLSSLLSTLVSPSNAYLATLILPASQYSAAGCQRAFDDRIAEPLLAAAHHRVWSEGGGGYRFSPFVVETTEETFAFSRSAVAGRAGASRIAPSNLAAAWTGNGVEETILGGVVQGRKPFEEKGASRMSRRLLFISARGLAHDLVGHDHVGVALSSDTYQHAKDSDLLADRRRVKDYIRQSALRGWVRNRGDSSFSIPKTAQTRES
ncbi:Adenosine deaminase/editase [Moelleriella libera RCEF 2490]|uniref:Adenosine deaminase/editase n=1 Tax=Moelleriella libera RCEF 2490 TaxID=1081109 RepID=A0A162IGY8_9HYPO|nr:Adenosine deaminase/editase [Moelleriella libera RCEF 2490]